MWAQHQQQRCLHLSLRNALKRHQILLDIYIDMNWISSQTWTSSWTDESGFTLRTYDRCKGATWWPSFTQNDNVKGSMFSTASPEPFTSVICPQGEPALICEKSQGDSGGPASSGFL